MRAVLPIILIGMSIVGFMMFMNPLYTDISKIRAEISSYDQALDNSLALEKKKTELTNDFNAINPDDLEKLQVMLPDSVDNIRLILEVEKIAAPYGMSLKDVKYNSSEDENKAVNGKKVLQASSANREYGDWDLEFSTQGTYLNFMNFVKDLEKNLRIVDIQSVEFSSQSSSTVGGITINSLSSDVYKYSVKIKTYWLKN